MQNGIFFTLFLYRSAKGKRLIINNYLFSRKNPDLQGFSKIKPRNPGGTRKEPEVSQE